MRILPAPEKRVPILTTRGVLGFVGSKKEGTPIPDREIQNLQTAIKDEGRCSPHSFITVGTRVRIKGGALTGVEGVLVSQGKDYSLVISVQLLQRSISLRIEGYDIEFI